MGSRRSTVAAGSLAGHKTAVECQCLSELLWSGTSLFCKLNCSTNAASGDFLLEPHISARQVYLHRKQLCCNEVLRLSIFAFKPIGRRSFLCASVGSVGQVSLGLARVVKLAQVVLSLAHDIRRHDVDLSLFIDWLRRIAPSRPGSKCRSRLQVLAKSGIDSGLK